MKTFCIKCGFGNELVGGIKPKKCAKCNHDFASTITTIKNNISQQQKVNDEDFKIKLANLNNQPTQQQQTESNYRPSKSVYQSRPRGYRDDDPTYDDNGYLDASILDSIEDNLEQLNFSVEVGIDVSNEKSGGFSLSQIAATAPGQGPQVKGKKISKREAKKRFEDLRAAAGKTPMKDF